MIRHATRVVLALVVVCSMAATPALAATPRATEDPRALAGGPGVAQTTTETANGCTFPFSKTDATGTEVTVDDPPERVVTLGASAAQTMWEIDARGKVEAVTPFAGYLENATDDRALLTYEGFTQRLSDDSVDRIVEIDPDVVIAANIIDDADVATLRDRGVTVYKFRTATDIESIYQKTRLTGRLTDECRSANRRTAELFSQVQTVRQATEGVDAKRVFVPAFGTTPGRNTFIDEIVTVAGGENLGRLAGDGVGYNTYETERIAAADPEWIVDTSSASVPGGLGTTTAGANGQTIALNPNYVFQPAPRIVLSMVEVVRTLYPERYRQARLGTLADEVAAPPGETWEVPYRDADPLDGTVENDTAYLRVQNGDAPRTQFPVPDGFDANSTVRLTEVAVDTREPNPIFTVTVENATADAPALPGDATMLAAYETDTEDLYMFATNATYTLDVPLTSVPGDPSALTVYRQSGDGWAPLETTVRVNETTQRATVTASADRLSAFAVGVAGGDARGTAEAAPEPMSAYATPDPVGSTADTPASAADPAAPSVEAAPADASATPGAVGTPVVALAALLAAALVVGRRR